MSLNTDDFLLRIYMRFHLLGDEKEWIRNYKCSSFVTLCILIATFLGDELLHILQKEKIAAKFALVAAALS